MTLALRRGSPPPIAPVDPSSIRSEHEAEGPRPIRCRACRRAITSDGARRAVDGAHLHVRTNPAGQTFEIGCFETADCATSGPPTLDATWFVGFAWSYAGCPGCGIQLGWHFEGGQEEFWGLILAALEEP